MKNNLKKWRDELDKIDEKILKILADRFQITKKIGEYKNKHSLNPFDAEREKEIFKNKNISAKNLNLDQIIVKKIFKIIIKKVKENHKKIKKNKKI